MRWFGWHHRLNGHEFEQVPGVGDGQVCSVHGSQSIGYDWATELNLICRVGSGWHSKNDCVWKQSLYDNKCKIF